MKKNKYFGSCLAQSFLEWKMFQLSSRENQNTFYVQ